MVDPAAIKKEWKEIFSTMDQDQSGSITCNELYKFIVKVSDNSERMVTPWFISTLRLQNWKTVERPRKWIGMR